MSTQSIEIKTNPSPTPGQPAVFSPQGAVAYAGDNITWRNNAQADHWPAPSASNPKGFIEYQIPPQNSSRGDLALGPNTITVVTASNAPAVVFTTSGPAPATGVSVKLVYKAATGTPPPPASLWAAAQGTFVVTNLGATSCSIPLDSSNFGAFGPTSGSITIAIPYTLNYVCALHPAETGSITVNPQQ
jgi:plastocyanin